MNAMTGEQIKGKIKSISREKSADPRNTIRQFMLERFLVRLSHSVYSNNFIVKGGLLVTWMLGIDKRSTMDIDASLNGKTLSKEEATKIIQEICMVPDDDGLTFIITHETGILSEAEYPGLRLFLEARIDKIIVPFQIDLSTGDQVTPAAIEYQVSSVIGGDMINVLSYNIETLFAEKLETIIHRGVLNTRMRDFYDVHALFQFKKNQINIITLKKALARTAKYRKTDKEIKEWRKILSDIASSKFMKQRWESYRKEYDYAADISFESTLYSIQTLMEKATIS